jgi:hypothetical protein
MNKKKLCLFVLLCFIATSVCANIQTTSLINTTPLSDLHKLGEGRMKVMFWSVYDAQLYGETKQYKPTQYPQAIKLTYLRDIKSNAFIEATDDQWQGLALTLPKKTQWLTQLKTIFPDIYENDKLILVVNKDQSSQFYYQAYDQKSQSYLKQPTAIGSINDKDFGTAFLAIWLSENTSRPKLRRQLIGK